MNWRIWTQGFLFVAISIYFTHFALTDPETGFLVVGYHHFGQVLLTLFMSIVPPMVLSWLVLLPVRFVAFVVTESRSPRTSVEAGDDAEDVNEFVEHSEIPECAEVATSTHNHLQGDRLPADSATPAWLAPASIVEAPAASMAALFCDLLRALRGRLDTAIFPFDDGQLHGVTSHPGVAGRVVYGADAAAMPDGLVLVADLVRSTEQVYVLMRQGERRFYWMDRIMSPWSADCGPAAQRGLEAALAEWDAGATSVYVSDGRRRPWPMRA